MAGEAAPRRRPPFRRLSQDRRREEIIEAAIEAFGRRPEPEVSIDDVAREAGTSRSSVYRYFEGKQELYEAAADRVGAELTDRLNEVAGGPPSVQMMRRLELYVDFLERYEVGYASLLGVGSRQAPEATLSTAQKVRDEICALTYRTLRVEEPSGTLRSTVQAWIAGVEWSGTEWLRTREPARPVLEATMAAQFTAMLAAAAVFDPLCADRVAWLLRVEPPDAPFGGLVRAVAGTFDVGMVGDLARFLSHRPI
ncbi:TetR/AcrR family transcriptional regulator [Actinomadura violacea]|uniref:TetR/AcrR family transcriptional regulator n=1 Tax=Actinomadura violacea TaxID=2819934 RepID=A0ABS3RJT0_9ACTN|nr:TetR/AcrR family transcriptional regulator [Actinomadura violacea]MBO2456971.1 TetR/AcrR family transcriptional regulator [Actinomadura violacea]